MARGYAKASAASKTIESPKTGRGADRSVPPSEPGTVLGPSPTVADHWLKHNRDHPLRLRAPNHYTTTNSIRSNSSTRIKFETLGNQYPNSASASSAG